MVLILILQFYFLTHFNVITVFCLASCIHCTQQKRRLLWLSTNCLSGSELIAMNQISYISVTDWRGRKNMFSLINLGECSKVLFWVKKHGMLIISTFWYTHVLFIHLTLLRFFKWAYYKHVYWSIIKLKVYPTLPIVFQNLKIFEKPTVIYDFQNQTQIQ